MRQRLSWTEKKADPYTMNQQHENNPVEKYKTFDTTMGEEPDMRRPWEQEGRTETGHPAPAGEQPAAAPAPVAAPAPEAAPAAAPVTARDAVLAARKLEDKALKCITIAQRMLPGASDDMIEVQATDLMYLPERCILATLERQVELAKKLASDCEPVEKAEEAAPAVEEKKAEEVAPAAPAVAPEAAPAPEAKPEEKKEEKKAEEAAPAPAAAPEAKPEEKEEVVKTASDADLLDIIFSDSVPNKTGAKKLSGIVKQASAGNLELSSLWNSAPDVSKEF